MPFKSDKQRKWMWANNPETARKWERYRQGGRLSGAPHSKGGIPILAEGGEFVVTKNSVNRSTIDTLEYINRHGDLPVSDARKRGKK